MIGFSISLSGGGRAGTSTPPAAVPVNTVAPAVSPSGSVDVGILLACTQGSWTNGPSTKTFQWRRDGVNISGETASAYETVEADIGTDITCAVIATNVVGASTAAISNAVGVSDSAPAFFTYLRPGGVDTYFRPDGTSQFVRP
jgi:hypothetical protein